MLTDEEIKVLSFRNCTDHVEFARAVIAAYQAKLLAGVEMPESNGYRIGTDGECEGVFTSKERQAYAAAAAAQAREKALGLLMCKS